MFATGPDSWFWKLGLYTDRYKKFLFPDNEGLVQLWQEYDERIIARERNHYLVEKIPQIQYHDLAMLG